MTPLTRSEAQRQRRQRERLQRQQAAAQQTSGTSTGNTQDTLIRGHTGLLYNVRSLHTANFQRTAIRGLQSENFMVDISRKHEFTDTTHYFAFQLREPASVRVFDPAGRSERRVSCSCEAFGEDPSTVVCAHIYASSPTLTFFHALIYYSGFTMVLTTHWEEYPLTLLNLLISRASSSDSPSFIMRLGETSIICRISSTKHGMKLLMMSTR